MNEQKSKPSDVLVLLEFQNQWTQPGLFHNLVKKELARQHVVEKTISLANAF
jgi:hypothetical protein